MCYLLFSFLTFSLVSLPCFKPEDLLNPAEVCIFSQYFSYRWIIDVRHLIMFFLSFKNRVAFSSTSCWCQWTSAFLPYINFQLFCKLVEFFKFFKLFKLPPLNPQVLLFLAPICVFTKHPHFKCIIFPKIPKIRHSSFRYTSFLGSSFVSPTITTFLEIEVNRNSETGIKTKLFA